MIELVDLRLNLENSNISSLNYNLVEETLSNLTNLTSLNLIIRNSSIGDDSGIMIGNCIGKLNNLENLILDFCDNSIS